MKPVWVLGNGQLGNMLQQAAAPLAISVTPCGFDDTPPQLPDNAVISAEIEQWPDTPLTRALSQHPGFVNPHTFPRLADRQTQKQLIDSLQLATSQWQALDTPHDWPALFARLGDTVMVKRRTGGYDGRGQWRIHAQNIDSFPTEMYGACIVEQMIPFESEVSLVGARSRDGQCVFYPLTRNLHQDGILRASVARPEHTSAHLQRQAEQMLGSLMHALEYVGVMAMECFVLGDQLLINELAPRVHNSGHWTQAGASASQFELHVRALQDLPLPTPVVSAPAVMINLIGTALNTDWLSVPLARLHWYGKEVRAGRKLGHINLTHPEPQQLCAALQALQPLLPEEYQSGLAWAQQQLR